MRVGFLFSAYLCDFCVQMALLTQRSQRYAEIAEKDFKRLNDETGEHHQRRDVMQRHP